MKNTVNVDTLDREMFSDFVAKGAVAQAIANQGTESFRDLMEDGFGAFYKYLPEIKPNIDPDRVLNKTVVEEMMKLSEYQQLRNYTMGDKVNSAGALGVVEEVFANMPEDVKQQQQRCEAAQTALDETMNDPNTETSIEDLKTHIEALKQAQEGLVEAMVQNKDAIRSAVRAAVAKAANEASDTETACKALGYAKTGVEVNATDPAAKAQVAKLLKTNPRIREIIKMAGRLTNIAQRKQAERVQYARTEVEGLEEGNSLMDLIPAEFIKLEIPELEDLFYKQYMEETLQQYKLRGKAPRGKGPVVVCVDCSGSMSGLPDTWAKGVALAMYWIARKQRRAFGFLLFNTAIAKQILLQPDEADTQGKLAEMLTMGAGGGTLFEPPLQRALDLMKETSFSEADIVFITDGDSEVSEQFLEQYRALKAVHKFHCFSVLIGVQNKVLDKFSDSVYNLGNMVLQNEGQVLDTVFSI